MTLCTGLAILGLCIPLPGTTRAAIETAGWIVLEEPTSREEWLSSRSFSSDRYRLTVSIYGTQATARAVILKEQASGPARLTPLLETRCRKGDGALLCRIGATSMGAFKCAGGWALFESGVPKLKKQLLELCERAESLSEETQKDGG
jgi:hypothetical protein